MLEHDVAVGDPLALVGGQSSALAHDQEQVFHHAGLQLVGQLDAFGVELVAVLIDHADIAATHDLAGLAVPRHLVGADGLPVLAQHDIAGGGHELVVLVVFHRIGFEGDRHVVFGRSGRGGRRTLDRAGIDGTRDVLRKRQRRHAERGDSKGHHAQRNGSQAANGGLQRGRRGREHHLPIAPPVPNCNPLLRRSAQHRRSPT